MQQPKPLCSEFRKKKIHACDVATRAIEVGDETEPDRVAAESVAALGAGYVSKPLSDSF